MRMSSSLCVNHFVNYSRKQSHSNAVWSQDTDTTNNNIKRAWKQTKQFHSNAVWSDDTDTTNNINHAIGH